MIRRVNLGEIQLSVLDEGAGPVIVLLHGFPLNHSMWRGQVEALSQSHRVIAPDLRGFGKSEPTGGTVSMEQFADDVAALLDALQISEPVTLCGLSMGGYIAWQFWKRHRSRVARMIQCDTRAAGDSEEARQTRLANAKKVLAEGTGFLADSMAVKLFSKTTRQHQPEVVEEMREIMLATTPMAVAAALLGMAQREDMTPALGEIDIPVLVIGGSEDEITPVPEMRDMVKALPQGRFVEIPHAGHMAPLEDPERTNAAMLEFLRT